MGDEAEELQRAVTRGAKLMHLISRHEDDAARTYREFTFSLKDNP